MYKCSQISNDNIRNESHELYGVEEVTIFFFHLQIHNIEACASSMKAAVAYKGIKVIQFRKKKEKEKKNRQERDRIRYACVFEYVYTQLAYPDVCLCIMEKKKKDSAFRIYDRNKFLV